MIVDFILDIHLLKNVGIVGDVKRKCTSIHFVNIMTIQRRLTMSKECETDECKAEARYKIITWQGNLEMNYCGDCFCEFADGVRLARTLR